MPVRLHSFKVSLSGQSIHAADDDESLLATSIVHKNCVRFSGGVYPAVAGVFTDWSGSGFFSSTETAGFWSVSVHTHSNYNGAPLVFTLI